MLNIIKEITNVCLTINSVAVAGLTAAYLTCPTRYLPTFTMSLTNALLESSLCLCVLGLCAIGERVIARANNH